MAIAFRQLASGTFGGAPATSSSFTATALDAVLGAAFCGGSSATGWAASGSTGAVYSLLTPPGAINDPFGNSEALVAALNIPSGAQTFTIGNIPSNFLKAWGYEYGGGVSGVTGNFTFQNAPGTGVGAVQGQPTFVPTGAVLVAIGYDLVNNPITLDTGTLRDGTSGTTGYVTVDYNGAGAVITPQFTAGTGGDDFGIWQWLLTTGPVFTQQPINAYLMPEQITLFTVSATASPGGGSLSYQWQDNRTGSFANCTDGSGATTSTYITAALGYPAQGRQYQCLVTDSNGTNASAPATVVVFENMEGSQLIRTRNHQGGVTMGLNILEWF